MIVNIISYKRDRYKKKTIGERIKKIDEKKKERMNNLVECEWTWIKEYVLRPRLFAGK
jgi:hypothetical protein